MFLFIYGLGIPFGFLLLGNIVKRAAGERVERATLAFFMTGYHYKCRYWEIVHMLQKMGIVLVVEFVPRSPSPHLRIYCTLFMTAVFLFLTQV